MDLFTIASIVIVLSALFGYINVRFLKLPNTIGLMLIAIAFTMVLFATTYFTPRLMDVANSLIGSIDFEHFLLDFLLGFLLFAGALHTNFDQLKIQRWPVLVFATIGVLTSTFLVAGLVYFIFPLFGVNPKFIHCLLFGALISPTDPIAVLGILKRAGVPKKLESKIVGESLFNDGVGVVVFLTIMKIAGGGATHAKAETFDLDRMSRLTPVVLVQGSESEPGNEQTDNSGQINPENDNPENDNPENDNPGHDNPENDNPGHDNPGHDEKDHDEKAGNEVTIQSVARMFGQEVIGGLLLGLILGYFTYFLLKSIDNYEIEVMITLACVMGGYSLAAYWHMSAPLAMVVAGLVVGNDTVRGSAMSRTTEEYVDKFWELMDMLMNAVLFVLIGLEILVLMKAFEIHSLWAGLASIAIVLGARFLSLIIPVHFFKKRLDFVPHTSTIMTWGGLRGGISIALALSLGREMDRDLFVTVTYCVVVFSIVVQGLSVGSLAKLLIGKDNLAESSSGH